LLGEPAASLARLNPRRSVRRALHEVRSRLGREDLSTLPALDAAFKAFGELGDCQGQLLVAAYAVQAIAAAYADFRQAAPWVARLRELQTAVAELSAPEQLVVCGAIISATVIVDTVGFDTPAIRAATDQALQLLTRDFDDAADNDAVAVARALLEYAEQQGDPHIFQCAVAAAQARRRSAALGPLIAGRYWIYEARCLFRLGAYDPDQPRDLEAEALLARAETLARDAALPNLQFDVSYTRLLLTAIRNDATTLCRLLEQMHAVLDYTRPNSVALYYQHLARVHLMRDEVAQAFEAARHALSAAQLAACVAGEQRSYQIMRALALLASGECERAIAEIETMLPGVSGRPHAILECTMRFAQAWQARLAGSAQYRNRLQHAMQQAQELNWPLFLNSLPRIAARLAADALRFDICAELAGRAVALRKLAPPSDADDSWPWPIRIYTLGRFSVLIDGQALEFSGKAQKKPLELLKLALALGGRSIDSGALIETLWPDLEGDAGRNAFDLTVHRLRKLLQHDEAVRVHDGKVTLDACRIWTNAWAFERLCGRIGEPGVREASATEATDLAQCLLRLYPCHFLAGEDKHWVLSMRERLRSKFLRSVLSLAQRLEEQEQRDDAIRLYLRAGELDPLAEEFQRRLMLCYRAQGRTGEAVDVYRRFRDLLSITLGVEPSAATQAVRRSLTVKRS
jgi:DNA-binding SARP family transcriptional activator